MSVAFGVRPTPPMMRRRWRSGCAVLAGMRRVREASGSLAGPEFLPVLGRRGVGSRSMTSRFVGTGTARCVFSDGSSPSNFMAPAAFLNSGERICERPGAQCILLLFRSTRPSSKTWLFGDCCASSCCSGSSSAAAARVGAAASAPPMKFVNASLARILRSALASSSSSLRCSCLLRSAESLPSITAVLSVARASLRISCRSLCSSSSSSPLSLGHGTVAALSVRPGPESLLL
mmetsp:Transcript_11152/g.35388  ORF Transcript_11152/g.35388 Transcript_11152/m.35388 type:complete len:233 (-) Transcript_11152:33-731(-)